MIKKLLCAVLIFWLATAADAEPYLVVKGVDRAPLQRGTEISCDTVVRVPHGERSKLVHRNGTIVEIVGAYEGPLCEHQGSTPLSGAPRAFLRAAYEAIRNATQVIAVRSIERANREALSAVDITQDGVACADADEGVKLWKPGQEGLTSVRVEGKNEREIERLWWGSSESVLAVGSGSEVADGGTFFFSSNEPDFRTHISIIVGDFSELDGESLLQKFVQFGCLRQAVGLIAVFPGDVAVGGSGSSSDVVE